MEHIFEYPIIEKIDESRYVKTFRCHDTHQQSIIVKVINSEYPSISEVALFLQGIEQIKASSINGIVKILKIKEKEGQLALILEDFDGIPLHQVLEKEKIPLREFLSIAIKLASTLGKLHKENIVHKEINPGNILVQDNVPGQEKIIKLTGFGISQLLTNESGDIYHPDVIRKKLVYISPEQTGKINRTIDYRSDLYSLGVILYELLTGRLPFFSDDPMEIIHSHIARKPKPPVYIDETIPEPVSAIVIKLLSKNAEERYQNSFGLHADLAHCLKELEQSDTIAPFILAEKDISIKFNIPRSLYGREEEIAFLMKTFEEMYQGARSIVLVYGPPGIGKSALINEIHRPIAAKRGYFIAGKYEVFRRNVPYNALIQAFQQLIGQILSESKERIMVWKEKILEALGANGKIITDILPDVELIIGKQQAIEELELEGWKNRFTYVIEKFFAVFADEEHPLTLFLDDLQWADLPSLELLQDIAAKGNISYLFFIGSYRDEELKDNSYLVETLKRIEKTRIEVNQLRLAPLVLDDVNCFIADFLKCDKNTSLPLARIVYQKSGGNPFFINQLVKTLYDDRVLKFDPLHGWQWDMEQVQNTEMTGDILKLMAQKISGLKEETRTLLKICACIGNRFHLENLAIITGKPIIETLAGIYDAVTEGLIGPGKDCYFFSHDRIREAAYSLIPEEEKSLYHLKIGRQILKETPSEKLNDSIFYIVNQLNTGDHLMSDNTERYTLVKLNMQAGIQAKASAAFLPAFKYQEKAVQILTKLHRTEKLQWEKEHHLSLTLYSEAAEAAYLCSRFDKMEFLVSTIMEHSRNILDTIKASTTRILAHIARNNPLEAIQEGLRTLKRLRITLPVNPKKHNIIPAIIKVRLAHRSKSREALLSLPPMNDPYKLAAMKILGILLTASYIAFPRLYPLIGLKLTTLSARYGNSQESIRAYFSYGLILCGVFEKIDAGYNYGKYGFKLLEKFNAQKHHCFASLIFNTFILHWKEHIRETLPPLLKGYRSGLESGDVEFAAYSLHVYCKYSFYCGKNLKELEKITAQNSSLIKELKQEIPLYFNRITHQVMLNLLDKSFNATSLTGEAFDEESMLPILEESNDRTALHSYYNARRFLAYLFEEFELALECSIMAEKYLDGVISTVDVWIFYFHDSLVRLALFRDLPGKDQSAMFKKINKNLKKLRKYEPSAPGNFTPRIILIQAELERVLGHTWEAAQLYDEAISLFRACKYPIEEALSHELAAKFYYSLKKENIARVYMQLARYDYENWGAQAKIAFLRERYPELSIRIDSSSIKNDTQNLVPRAEPDSSHKPPSNSGSPDLATVIRLFQTLSGETDIAKLPEKIVQIAIEHAGAQKGILILKEEDDSSSSSLYIKAEGFPDRVTTFSNPIPVDESSALSPGIIQYVNKTRQDIVLDRACKEGIFINDPYIMENKPKSILCMAIKYGDKIPGFIYLENNHSEKVFSKERIELMSIILSQAAISIENARLLDYLNSSR
ncbi:MAG: AAA family ATPase [bacterium]|nr:AAA family ATPase [bacterium]